MSTTRIAESTEYMKQIQNADRVLRQVLALAVLERPFPV